MLTDRPLISIIMPAYNAGKFIEKAIRSVFSQDYTHWELIIVDDCSTDNTASIIQQLTAEPQGHQIRYIKVDRLGTPSAVRNVGLKCAQGEFIAFLDADDEYYDTTLSMLYQPFSERPEIHMAFGFPQGIDHDSNALGFPPQLEKISENQYRLASHVEFSWKYLCAKFLPCYLSAMMFKRSCLETVGHFDETLIVGEDVMFYYKLFMLGLENVALLPTCIYKYRISDDSVTRNYSRERISEWYRGRVHITDWIFSQPIITPELQGYKSAKLAENHFFFLNRCIENNDYWFSLSFLKNAFLDPNVRTQDAMFAFCQFMGRRYLSPVYQCLLRLRSLRHRLLPNKRPQPLNLSTNH